MTHKIPFIRSIRRRNDLYLEIKILAFVGLSGDLVLAASGHLYSYSKTFL